MKDKQLTVLGNNQLIKRDALASHIRRSLPWRLKLNRQMNETHITQHLTVDQLIYHPFWIAKTLVIADRKPFPPRKSPNMIFIDAVSQYRGLFANIPELQKVKAKKNSKIIKAKLQFNEVEDFIKDVQKNQINRTYLLKKPDHKIVDYFLVYLPLWHGRINSPYWKEELYINANTGEREDYLAELWHRNQRVKL